MGRCLNAYLLVQSENLPIVTQIMILDMQMMIDFSDQHYTEMRLSSSVPLPDSCSLAKF